MTSHDERELHTSLLWVTTIIVLFCAALVWAMRGDCHAQSLPVMPSTPQPIVIMPPSAPPITIFQGQHGSPAVIMQPGQAPITVWGTK